jgi:ketosteroid isomerase-like protein
MYPGWERDQQRRRDYEEARRDLAAGGGGGCVLYPLGALALIGLCCASPTLLEGHHSPFHLPQFGLPNFGGKEDSPTPDLEQVVQQYMAATIEENAPDAASVTCAEPHLDPVTSWAAKARAAADNGSIRFHSNAGMVTGDSAFVTTVATVTVTDANGAPAAQQEKTFVFNMVNEDGWKVCAATTD